MGKRKDSIQTREQIIEAAIHAFAEKGFYIATIAEICERAGTNVASVNYHFGDKETLYLESWQRAFHDSLEKHPPHRGVPSDAPAEKRLYGHIRALLDRIFDPECHEFEIIHKEMGSPTGHLAKMKIQCLEPLRAMLSSIVRDIVGYDISDAELTLCEMSIRSQCLNPMIMSLRRRNVEPLVRTHPNLSSDPTVLADHIWRFSLAGLRNLSQNHSETIPAMEESV
ncbi:MAG: TetR/AcrR family transcriptional regulator [Candidatus Sumerlaeia bacterium]